MAFFKFRQQNAPPAKKAPRAADAAAASAPADTVEGVRRRARHRLIGAVVLVVVAVIGFPLLFDTEPRPVAIKAPITIPDRDSAPALAAPKPVGQVAVPASASLGEHEQVVPSATATASAKPAAQTGIARASEPSASVREDEARAKAKQEADAKARHDEQAKAKQEADAKARREEQAKAKQDADAKASREAEARSQRDEAARARAALEGQGSAKAAAAASDAGRFVVQIGAFAEADSAQQIRRKAEGAGLKTYTQVVSTADGKRTRVRVGPFDSRAEAEKAAASLKKAGLPGSILSL